MSIFKNLVSNNFVNTNMKSHQITIAVILVIQITGRECIVNEKNSGLSNMGDWPWHAAIFDVNIASLRYRCGGTVINSNSILTAAYCMFENNRQIIPERLLVYLGKHNLKISETSGKAFEVDKIIPHPNFNTSNFSNDIAIIRLSAEATFNDYIQPICLWNSNKAALSEVIDKIGTVVGWGLTEMNELSPILRHASMPVVSLLNCVSSNPDFFGNVLSEKSFCAGYRNGTSVCNGDSGGSIIFQDDGVYRIRGIISLSPVSDSGLCDSTEYAVFTDVAKYLTWIEDVVPELKLSASKSEIGATAQNCGQRVASTNHLPL